MRLPILQLSCRLSGKLSHHSGLSATLQTTFGSLRLLAFPKANIAVEREEICECDSHIVHKVSKRRLNDDWLGPQESDSSQMHRKFSSDWLPSYMKTMQPVLQIFKMAEYFPDSTPLSLSLFLSLSTYIYIYIYIYIYMHTCVDVCNDILLCLLDRASFW